MRSQAYTLALLLVLALAKEVPNGCSGTEPNNAGVLEVTPTLVSEVPHGKLWKYQQDTNVLYIAKVWGSAYEMGFAEGQMFGPQIIDTINGMLDFYLGRFSRDIQHYGIPPEIADFLVYTVGK